MFHKTYPVTPPILHKDDYLYLFRTLFGIYKKKETLEKELAQLFSRKYAFLTSSARSVIRLILLSLELPKNTEVLLPAYTCIVVPDAVVSAGFIPKFVDVDTSSGNVPLEYYKKALTKNSKVLILTHMFGYMNDVDSIVNWAKDNKLFVIEDACLALGSIYKKRVAGSYGDVSIFSFNTGKHITAFGGGIMVTDSKILYEKTTKLALQSYEGMPLIQHLYCYILLFLGQLLFHPLFYGVTLRLPEIFPILKRARNPIVLEKKNIIKVYPILEFQLGLIASQIKRIKYIIKRRQKLSRLYYKKLKITPGISLFMNNSNCVPSASHFSILINDISKKEKLMNMSLKYGIRLGEVFDYVCPLVSSYSQKGNYSGSNYIATRILNLPFYSDLSDEECNLICQRIRGLIQSL